MKNVSLLLILSFLLLNFENVFAIPMTKWQISQPKTTAAMAMIEFGEYPIQEVPASIEARFIRKIEQFRDNEIRLVLRDGVAAHPIACTDSVKYSYAPKAEFRVAHSDDALVVMFEVEESHLRALAKSGNQVQEDSCVGISIANPADSGVFNFDANCIGTLHASYQGCPLSEELLSQIRIFGSLANIPIDSRGEGQMWWLVMIIPIAVLGLQGAPKMLYCNLHKWGDKCDRPHRLSWVEEDSYGEIQMA